MSDRFKTKVLSMLFIIQYLQTEPNIMFNWFFIVFLITEANYIYPFMT